jgi:hypothetical protein
LGLEMGWAGRPGPTGLDPLRPSPRPPSPDVASRVFQILPPSACGPLSSVSLRIGRSSLSRKIRHFLARSSKFSIFSGWVHGLLGVVFTSLLDFYRASRPCHEVLNELILEVLLSTLKPCINTKLQNRHAQVNLLYHGG